MTQSILEKIIASQETKEISHIPWKDLYKDLMSPLLEKERGMAAMRYGLEGQEEKTLENIGVTYHLTRERVRQIIKLALKKIASAIPKSTAYTTFKQRIVVEAERYAGVVPAEKLQNGFSGDSQERALVGFLLREVGIPGLELVESDDSMKESWKLVHISLEPFRLLIQELEREVGVRGGADEAALFQKESENEQFQHILSLALNPELRREVFRNILELAARLEHNTLGVWGLKGDSLVIPKKVSDKIYVVLKHGGKPMHFREITKAINEMKFDEKRAYEPTIHNELILDKRFVLVGRGVYALIEWGYVRGVVADVIEDIIREKGPLTRREIENEVLKQRMVKAGTIYLSLTNKKRFMKDKMTGKYSLISPIERSQASQGTDSVDGQKS